MKMDHYLRILNSQVVGYQNLDVAAQTDGGVTYLVNTIPAVGVDLEEVTLGDFKVVPPDGGLTADVSVYLTTFTSDGQLEGEYLYIDQALVDAGVGGVETPGWYTKESVDNWTPEAADDVIIAFGRGVIILSDCGAKVTCAGEVLSNGVTFEITSSVDGGVTYTGNTSPVDLTLKDFAITPPEGGLTADVSVYLTTFTSDGQLEGEYLYIDQALVDAGVGGVETPGWYTKESVDNWTPESAGDVEIAAGRMFIILSDCGAKITIPSAL